QGRDDAAELRRFAKRRLAFLNKPGFDRFGKNKLFVPLLKWEAFRNDVVNIRDYCRDYETAYNTLQASIERDENTNEIVQARQTAEIQVTKEKERLEEARRVALTEKEAYVPAIKELESSMDGYLAQARALLADVNEQAQFTQEDMFAVLQGATGFLSAAAGDDPFGALGAAIETAEHFATQCNAGTLQDNLGHLTNWLNFGKAYQKLEDSSDLDFDTMDVGSVPEMMQANLEMNKEGLTADLVCLLEERLPPNAVAKFKEQLERFFIAGAARIDLIAKVIDLDNEIGGYNFDIPNLEETASELEMLRNVGDSPLEDQVQQMFLDNLLTSYQKMEASFSKNLYLFYKSFEFRTLWDETQRLASFERTASEAAAGNGQLQGVVQLNNALQEIDDLESRSRKCFTKFEDIDRIHKWEFNNENHTALFEDLHRGKAKLHLGMEESCETCYNVRLLKMYIELYGDNTQGDNNMPLMVHLKARHGSASYFKDGSGHIKHFRQKLSLETSWHKLVFNRLTITNPDKCEEQLRQGIIDSSFCMTKDDSRFESMCCHFLSGTPCDDAQSGSAECQSLFGTYDMEIPINENAECGGSLLPDKNCKNFDRSIYTKMNVWFHFMYWSDAYPSSPNDPRCSVNGKKRDEVNHVAAGHLKSRLTLTHRTLKSSHRKGK
ncbi:uncharacterized protein LOC110247684, partial [Exaiptasia diaphana]|uniref:Uncharacterized protein n=1 Tax=Exaiptasia diaphana TaxID=2652724 RepID=A0A913YQV0_EXADI